MNPAPPVTMIRRGRTSTSEFWCCISDTACNLLSGLLRDRDVVVVVDRVGLVEVVADRDAEPLPDVVGQRRHLARRCTSWCFDSMVAVVAPTVTQVTCWNPPPWIVSRPPPLGKESGPTLNTAGGARSLSASLIAMHGTVSVPVPPSGRCTVILTEVAPASTRRSSGMCSTIRSPSYVSYWIPLWPIWTTETELSPAPSNQ